MKNLVYILGQAHTGSTLTDCILGEHPNFISSGELRYLGWQLYRNRTEEVSASRQSVCSCGKGFYSCNYWSEVIQVLNEKDGINLIEDPWALKNAFFNYFS